MHRAKAVFPRAATSTPRVFTGTRVIKGRTRPWHSCAQTGLLSELFSALQFFLCLQKVVDLSLLSRICLVSKLNLCSISPHFRYFYHRKTVVFPMFSDKSRIAPNIQLYSWSFTLATDSMLKQTGTAQITGKQSLGSGSEPNLCQGRVRPLITRVPVKTLGVLLAALGKTGFALCTLE